MIIYIATAEDLGKNLKLLSSLSNNDVLYILYTEKNATIPIEAYQLLSSLKCKVEFKPYTDSIEEQLKFAYELGYMCGENKANAAVKSLSSSKLALLSIFNDKPARKRMATTKTEAETIKKPAQKAKKEEIMPPPEINENPVQKNTEEPAQEKKKRGRKSKADKAFDKAYDELVALFGEVKTKTFNPESNLYGIVKAVKSAISEKTELKDSFKIWFPGNSDKIIQAFAGKEDRLISIVKNLDDEVK